MNASDTNAIAPSPAAANPNDASTPTPQATGLNAPPALAPVPEKPARSAFVPMLLTTLAVLGWFGFQALQLLEDRDTIQTARVAQQQTVDNAARMRASLDALAADTQRMAEAGNVNARTLVDELEKRGVTINANASTAVPSKD